MLVLWERVLTPALKHEHVQCLSKSLLETRCVESKRSWSL